MIKWILGGTGIILVVVVAFVGLRHHEAATRMQEMQELEYHSEIMEHVFDPCIREAVIQMRNRADMPQYQPMHYFLDKYNEEVLSDPEQLDEFKESILNNSDMQKAISGLNGVVSGMSLETRITFYGSAAATCVKSAMEIFDSELKKLQSEMKMN